ncbi:phosphoglycerate mutase family protein [bacterium]|nr:phosphoglycerate mutase family protein [bacterium]
MKNNIELAEDYQNRAWEVIRDAKIMDAWTSIGATVNLVGSLKTGLLIKHLDIDFHVYTSPIILADSFKAMSIIADNHRVKQIKYANLLDTEECLEWHAWYEDHGGALWQIDMIHILFESPLAGKVERVTERISEVLTEETRKAILSIKNAVPDGRKVKGIEIYMAVLRDGIRTYADFVEWKQSRHHTGIIDWEP